MLFWGYAATTITSADWRQEGRCKGARRAQCIGPSDKKKGHHRATGSLKNKNKISDVGDPHKSQGGVSLGQGGGGLQRNKGRPIRPTLIYGPRGSQRCLLCKFSISGSDLETRSRKSPRSRSRKLKSGSRKFGWHYSGVELKVRHRNVPSKRGLLQPILRESRKTLLSFMA